MPFVLSAFAGCQLTSVDIAMAVSAILILCSAGWSWAQPISCLLGPRTPHTPRSDRLCSSGSCCNEFHPSCSLSFFTQQRALWVIVWFLVVILWETDMMFPSRQTQCWTVLRLTEVIEKWILLVNHYMLHTWNEQTYAVILLLK